MLLLALIGFLLQLSAVAVIAVGCLLSDQQSIITLISKGKHDFTLSPLPSLCIYHICVCSVYACERKTIENVQILSENEKIQSTPVRNYVWHR